MEMLRK